MGNKKFVTKMLPVTLEMKKPPARIRRLESSNIRNGVYGIIGHRLKV